MIKSCARQYLANNLIKFGIKSTIDQISLMELCYTNKITTEGKYQHFLLDEVKNCITIQ